MIMVRKSTVSGSDLKENRCAFEIVIASVFIFLLKNIGSQGIIVDTFLSAAKVYS